MALSCCSFLSPFDFYSNTPVLIAAASSRPMMESTITVASPTWIRLPGMELKATGTLR